MKRLAIVATLCLAGCATVPVLDADGNPVLNPDGTQKMRWGFDTGKLNEAVGAIAPLVPAPFGMALPLIAGLATLVINKRKDTA
jgi:hypothetical protein